MGYDRKYGLVTVGRGNIGADEPVVVFRAQDALLPKVLRIYQILCEVAGSPQHHLDLIHDAAQDVKAWQATHHTKIPESASLRP